MALVPLGNGTRIAGRRVARDLHSDTLGQLELRRIQHHEARWRSRTDVLEPKEDSVKLVLHLFEDRLLRRGRSGLREIEELRLCPCPVPQRLAERGIAD